MLQFLLLTWFSASRDLFLFKISWFPLKLPFLFIYRQFCALYAQLKSISSFSSPKEHLQPLFILLSISFASNVIPSIFLFILLSAFVFSPNLLWNARVSEAHVSTGRHIGGLLFKEWEVAAYGISMSSKCALFQFFYPLDFFVVSLSLHYLFVPGIYILLLSSYCPRYKNSFTLQCFLATHDLLLCLLVTKHYFGVLNNHLQTYI